MYYKKLNGRMGHLLLIRVSKLRPAGQIRPQRHFIRPHRHFVNHEKTIYLWNICSFGKMQLIGKQSNYV